MTQPKEIILTAAIMSGNLICSLPRPYRHTDIMMEMEGDLPMAIQGFVTSEGRFVNRSEAYGIAHRANQIIEQPHVIATPGALYTEDLW